MRVLFWSSNFWPVIGGVEVLAAALLPALRQRGHEFIVVTLQAHPDQPDEAVYRGIPVFRLPFVSALRHGDVGQVMAIRQRVAQLKRSFAGQLMHLNAVGPADFFHLTTAQTHPVPVLVTVHGEWPHLGGRRDSLAARTLASAAWVAGCSAAILKRARDLVPEIAARSSVIYNGLEPSTLVPAPLPIAAPRLLCLGRLAPEKGFDVAVTAFATLAPRYPEARLVIAGDGPARLGLEQQAARLGIAGRVDFLGWVDPGAVASLINAATLMLMPSRSESLPMVALEAGSLARPLVGTQVGGVPEVVVHGSTGLLVESEDARALADAAAFLLDHPKAATQMGEAARRRVRQAFSFDRHVDAYDALYQRLARGN